jgi:N-acetylglutamate synthase-like GNAT family acetyltransferase
MLEMRVRHGEVSDLDALRACVEAAFSPYVPRIGQRPAPLDTDFEPLLRDGRVWVAEQDGRVVGTIVLVADGETAEIRSVSVLPTCQRQGVGRTLIAHAETVARQAGHSRVRLYANARLPELVLYYAGLGYTEVERRRDRGFDRVFMAKTLDPLNPPRGDVQSGL